MNQIEAWIGGGIYGLLVIFTLQLFRRTKDVDERRDALTEIVRQGEREATEDRNYLLEELRMMRQEINGLRQESNDDEQL